MTWFNHPGTFDYMLMALFAMSYILYLARMYYLSRKYRLIILNLLKKIFLRTVYITLIFVALFGPSFGDVRKEVAIIGKDIFILLDVSTSMTANDLSPSRLVVSIEEIRKIVPQLDANDRVGLIVYSDEASLLCPLTYDKSALDLFLSGIQAGQVGTGGSSIQTALQLCLQKFNIGKPSSNNIGRAVVVASDGENFSSGMEELSRKFKKQNIRIYALGAGTSRGSKIPLKKGFKKDASGNTVITRLHKQNLLALASLTNGRYYKIDGQESPGLIGREISKLEGRFRNYQKMNISSNKYFFFLLAALVLMVFDGLKTIKVIEI